MPDIIQEFFIKATPEKVFPMFSTPEGLAHEDWAGTRIGCRLQPEGNDRTRAYFYHLGWPQPNEHWRVSCYCWAMYLRILRRNLEFGEFVPYEKRLDV